MNLGLTPSQPPGEPEVTSPSTALLTHLANQLTRWLPFSDMAAADVTALLSGCEQRYLAPGDVLAAPAQGPVRTLFLVREGTVHSRLPDDAGASTHAAFAYSAGELVPVAAWLARRPVRAIYTAADDVFVLALPEALVEDLVRRSPAFAGFLQKKVATLLDKSRQALRDRMASEMLGEQGLETPLRDLRMGSPVQCHAGTAIGAALEALETHQVGSMVVTDAEGRPQGIFTRHDLPRLLLQPGFRLDAPVAGIMRSPVRSLDESASAQDAALLMTGHGIRHVPVTREGRLVGVVSERDLFALQRTSLQQVGASLRRARSPDELPPAADGIRRLARQLLGQGVQSHQLTQLVSHLNDLLTQRLLQLTAQAAGVDLQRLCWVALGSEGRGEQTIATDQDNALLVTDDVDDAALDRLRAWAGEANTWLDRCGYPLCKGGIMAGQAACSLRQSEWLARLTQWIEHGSPQDLLKASIFFDMRALAGDASLLSPLADRVAERVRATPRFLHQLAINALAHRPPLDWRGQASADQAGGLDLKLQGTALFVDAARILALAHGVQAISTRERLQGAGRALGLEPQEYASWIGAFEFLQALRLRVQVEGGQEATERPNWLPLARLSDLDRRILAASLREARRLQQRLEMDYAR